MALGSAAPTWGSSSGRLPSFNKPSSGGQGQGGYGGGIGGLSNYTATPEQTAYARGYGAPPNQAAANAQYRSIYDQVMTQYGPQLQESANQRAIDSAVGSETARNYDRQGANLRSDYGYDLRYNDLDQRGLGIDRGAANRDIGYYQQMLGYLPQYRDLAGTELQNTLAKLRTQGNMERIGNDSEYTGRGAYLTPMRSVKNYASILGQQQGETSANVGYKRDMLGLDEKEAGLKRSLGGSQDALARLDLESQRLGIDREKLKSRLDQGLASLGYDRFMSTAQLLEKMSSGNGRDAQLAAQIFQEINTLMQGLSGGLPY